ncbi:VOC family protein [Ampullimonas aquatilis]|uniref:VOC family protein n=1 Tax=Ampullimonas aquatilis TaxID=1341549 RepID=UPI003C713B5E
MKKIESDWAKSGIHSINHFVLALPDLAEAEKFMLAFGLRVDRKDDELHVRASASEHVWLKAVEGSKKSFEYLSVGCFDVDFDQICKQVIEAGGIEAAPHIAGSSNGFWFRDPDGTLLQLQIAAKMMPDSKAEMENGSVAAGIQGAAFRSSMQKISPTRLAHMLLFTPDVKRAIVFYEKGLGVKVADSSQDIVAFTYARHGCDHHLIAFLKSNGRGIHHSSWDIPGLEKLGVGSAQMRKAGYTHQWGVGRHVLGSNYFDYIQDSFGKWWEYSCHIDYIPSGFHWEGGDHDPENSLYLWGPDLPSDFVDNNEV